MIGQKHLDSPIDYKVLWGELRQRIEELAAKAASDAMHCDTEADIRRKQGEYRFGYILVSEMDRILDDARAAYGPLRSLRNGSET